MPVHQKVEGSGKPWLSLLGNVQNVLLSIGMRGMNGHIMRSGDYFTFLRE